MFPECCPPTQMIHAKSDFQLEKSFGHARLNRESRTQQKFEEARGEKPKETAMAGITHRRPNQGFWAAMILPGQPIAWA